MLIRADLLFGHSEIIALPDVWDGRRLSKRYRMRSVDGDGKVCRDEIYDPGCFLVFPAERWARNDCLRDIGRHDLVERETWTDRLRRLFGIATDA